MRKANFCYEHNRKKESMANWKAKKNNNYDQNKKEFVPKQNSKNNKVRNFFNKNFHGNKNNSQNNQNNQKNKEPANNLVITQRTLNEKNP